MIIKTERSSYIVKFTFCKYFMSFKSNHIDNYGRIHLSMWDEPITQCLVKEIKRRATEPCGEWRATARCRYEDKYSKTEGAKISLKKALKYSRIDEDEQQRIFDEVFKNSKFKEHPSDRHYMQSVGRDEFIFNRLSEELVKMSSNVKFMKNLNNGKGNIVAKNLATHFNELVRLLATKEGA